MFMLVIFSVLEVPLYVYRTEKMPSCTILESLPVA